MKSDTTHVTMDEALQQVRDNAVAPRAAERKPGNARGRFKLTFNMIFPEQ